MLNRTLFYPTGGGQPHDIGSLGGAKVLSVEQINGGIRHVVDALPAHSEISAEIDWRRRWRHMHLTKTY
ncbi:MAG: hypothetical protein GY759_02230 [Chloroflexi bacterium]|nr:hypothetical protein [Chloroflexota bacterium]